MLATALALLITGCAQQTFTVQNKPAAVAPETIRHHFFVSGIGRGKSLSTMRYYKICVTQKMLLKQKTQQTFVNGLLGFITLGNLYSAGSVSCVLLHNNCMEFAHRYGQLYLPAH